MQLNQLSAITMYILVPSSYPTSLSCSSISSTSVHLSWNPLESKEFNGISQGYVVYFRPLREWKGKSVWAKRKKLFLNSIYIVGESTRLHTLDTLLTVKQLEKFQNYTVQVTALTRIGEGPKSRPVYCRTMEDVPSAPANIKAVPLSTHSILVTWLPPASPAGDITGYAIHLSTMMAGQPITDKIEVGHFHLSYGKWDIICIIIISSGFQLQAWVHHNGVNNQPAILNMCHCIYHHGGGRMQWCGCGDSKSATRSCHILHSEPSSLTDQFTSHPPMQSCRQPKAKCYMDLQVKHLQCILIIY